MTPAIKRRGRLPAARSIISGMGPGALSSSFLHRPVDVHERVDGAAVQPYFEMAVRAGRPAGLADTGDYLSGAYALADVRDVFLVVRVTGHVTVAVIDLDDVAVAGTF